MESVSVTHFSFPGDILFWVPISLRIEATGPASLLPNFSTFVEVIDEPDWKCEQFSSERRILHSAAPVEAGSVDVVPITTTLIWHTFLIRPSRAVGDQGHNFEALVHLRVGFLGSDGVLLAHTYPSLDEPGLKILHRPVCFYDAYILSTAGTCQASTVPRSVPPEWFHHQQMPRPLTQDPELDGAIRDQILWRSYDPGMFIFQYKVWRVHVRVWGYTLDWKRRDEVGRLVNRQIMEANIRLIDEGMNALEPAPAHFDWGMAPAGVTGLGMGGI